MITGSNIATVSVVILVHKTAAIFHRVPVGTTGGCFNSLMASVNNDSWNCKPEHASCRLLKIPLTRHLDAALHGVSAHTTRDSTKQHGLEHQWRCRKQEISLKKTGIVGIKHPVRATHARHDPCQSLPISERGLVFSIYTI